MATSLLPAPVFQLLADTVLAMHVLYMLFVVLGLVAIYLGHFLNWRWIRGIRYRLLHLFAIGVVVVQSWVGVICPLTTLEMWLRSLAGDATYSGSFIQHWLQSLLYYDAPVWAFVACYTLFGGLVLASWFLVKPERRKPVASLP